MPILLIILGAVLVYLLQHILYAKFWDDRLHAEVSFEEKAVHEGEETHLVETLSNGKWLPLPWVYVKFQLRRNLQVEHYRSDLFSIRFHQQIRRRISFLPEKRGYVTVRGVDLISHNLLITQKYAKTLPGRATLLVYPKLLEREEIEVPYRRLLGDILSRRFGPEDPYQLRGIREYQPYDSLRSVNFTASARSGHWMVNMYDQTVTQKVVLDLDLDRPNQYMDMRLYENAIRLCATLAQKLEAEGIPVALVTNGRDVVTKQSVSVEEGCSDGHLDRILESLARLEVELEVEDFTGRIRELASCEDENSIHVLIAPYFGTELLQVWEELEETGAACLWILPVLSQDLTDAEQNIRSLPERFSHVELWEVTV